MCLIILGVRNYQIVEKSDKDSNDIQLVEIGPRFVLIPIRIFDGSLGGPTLYQNSSYTSPNEERASLKRSKGLTTYNLQYYQSDIYRLIYMQLIQGPICISS